jgi:hypothetical protein
VAASSFDMKVTNPKFFLDEIDVERLSEILGHRAKKTSGKSPTYVEPTGDNVSQTSDDFPPSTSEANPTSTPKPVGPSQTNGISGQTSISSDILRGKVQVLGDFIDTDAVSSPPLTRSGISES